MSEITIPKSEYDNLISYKTKVENLNKDLSKKEEEIEALKNKNSEVTGNIKKVKEEQKSKISELEKEKDLLNSKLETFTEKLGIGEEVDISDFLENVGKDLQEIKGIREEKEKAIKEEREEVITFLKEKNDGKDLPYSEATLNDLTALKELATLKGFKAEEKDPKGEIKFGEIKIEDKQDYNQNLDINTALKQGDTNSVHNEVMKDLFK